MVAFRLHDTDMTVHVCFYSDLFVTKRVTCTHVQLKR